MSGVTSGVITDTILPTSSVFVLGQNAYSSRSDKLPQIRTIILANCSGALRFKNPFISISLVTRFNSRSLFAHAGQIELTKVLRSGLENFFDSKLLPNNHCNPCPEKRMREQKLLIVQLYCNNRTSPCL